LFVDVKEEITAPAVGARSSSTSPNRNNIYRQINRPSYSRSAPGSADLGSGSRTPAACSRRSMCPDCMVWWGCTPLQFYEFKSKYICVQRSNTKRGFTMGRTYYRTRMTRWRDHDDHQDGCKEKSHGVLEKRHERRGELALQCWFGLLHCLYRRKIHTHL
jgi:hypothetical protein